MNININTNKLCLYYIDTKNVSKKLIMPPTRDKIAPLFKLVLACAFFLMLDNCERVGANENISITHIEELCIQKCPDHVSELFLENMPQRSRLQFEIWGLKD